MARKRTGLHRWWPSSFGTRCAIVSLGALAVVHFWSLGVGSDLAERPLLRGKDPAEHRTDTPSAPQAAAPSAGLSAEPPDAGHRQHAAGAAEAPALQRTRPAAVAQAAGEPGACRLPLPQAGAQARGPRVGAVVPVHPPKFYDAALFLEQYIACPGAMAAMSVVLVFTDAGHLALFQATVANISAGVVGAMNSLWTAVVAYALPDFLSKMTDATSRNMKTAAYKKWFGIAYLLDNEPHAPAYGLMLDADLRLFNTSDCSLSGRWSRLLSRIERSEARKEWLGIPHANMTRSDTREGAWAMSMQRRVLRVNAVWVVGGGATFDRHCVTEQCQRLRWQVDNVFFTWWTDLPYVNLRVASRMLVFLGGGRAKLETANCSFQSLSRSLEYTPFEHLAYQQWCVLHEGFAFRDMSDVVTSTANWGSFMEGPAAGARLVDLRPGWVSARALAMAQDGEIPDLSPAEPLLLFHIDRQAKDVIVPTRTEMQRRGVSINL